MNDRQTTPVKDRSLGNARVEEAFRLATIVDCGLVGIFECPNEPLSECIRQEILAIWEVASRLQKILANAYCPPEEEEENEADVLTSAAAPSPLRAA